MLPGTTAIATGSMRPTVEPMLPVSGSWIIH